MGWGLCHRDYKWVMQGGAAGKCAVKAKYVGQELLVTFSACSTVADLPSHIAPEIMNVT